MSWKLHPRRALVRCSLLGFSVAPTLHYFYKVGLFDLGDIRITIGFLTLITIWCILVITTLVLRNRTIPTMLILPFIFTMLGIIVAIVRGWGVRWWFPPLLRWSGSVLAAIVGYHSVKQKLLTPRSFRVALIVSMLLPLAIGFAQLMLGAVPLLNGAYRVFGTFNGSPLGYSIFLSSAAIMLLSAPNLKVTDVVLFVASAVMILVSFSRLTLVAFTISTLLVLSLQKRVRVVVLVGVLLMVIAISSQPVREQLSTRFSVMVATDIGELWKEAQSNAYRGNAWWISGIDNSLLLRIKTLVIGLDAFRRHPLCGWGLGSFVPIYERATGRPDVAAHNDYLLYLVETGIIGLGVYLLMQIEIIRKLLVFNSSDRGTRLFVVSVVGAYLSTNIFSFLSNSYYFYEAQLWIWMGIGMSIALLSSPRNKTEQI